jgi:hypothetical protein
VGISFSNSFPRPDERYEKASALAQVLFVFAVGNGKRALSMHELAQPATEHLNAIAHR